MCLKPGVEIGLEIHPKTTQFIRFESGSGYAIIQNKKIILNVNDAIVIPPGVQHNIFNNSKETNMKLYTIYSPPEHKPGLVERFKPH